jgi:predicted amidophosphoribosyltransferase
MVAVYTCGCCGKPVSKSTRVCPHCGARLAGIKCQSCGFVGSESDFAGDRCPKCRSVVRVNRQQSTSKPERCAKCGQPMQSGEVTCAHCGYTRWGQIVVVAILGLGLFSAVLWGPQMEQSICTWSGAILGGIFLLVTMSWLSKAIRTPRRY